MYLFLFSIFLFILITLYPGMICSTVVAPRGWPRWHPNRYHAKNNSIPQLTTLQYRRILLSISLWFHYFSLYLNLIYLYLIIFFHFHSTVFHTLYWDQKLGMKPIIFKNIFITSSWDKARPNPLMVTNLVSLALFSRAFLTFVAIFKINY